MRNVDWRGSRIGPRRPHRYANQLPDQIEAAIVAAKREKPNLGRPQRSGSDSFDDCREQK